MDLRFSLKRQHRAGLAMLRQCIERCPDDLWVAGEHPRNFWRIAYHAVFYTDLYLYPSWEAFTPWEKHRDSATNLWGTPEEVAPYSKDETLAYLDAVMDAVDARVDAIDLELPETGFDWYPEMSKLEHLLVNLRHVQGHVGQLSELLMQHGIDINWVGK